MLTGEKWAEGIPKKDGERYITVEDTDEGALEILFNVIHGRNSRVPQTTTFVMLVKIAILIDYYS